MLNKEGIRILYIDLTTEEVEKIERQDLKDYLGGVGVAIKLFDEYKQPDLDVFHEKQPIIFSIGPLETIYPVVTKTVAVFRSPLTGELGESYAGLRLGMAIRFAGYDAILITGKAKGPIYLSINSQSVELKKAQPLWGLDTEESGRLLREMESGSGLRSILRIGQGGERGIRYAGVNVDTYRHFGRLGLGSLFGSKNLKGMVITGDSTVPIEGKKEYQKTYAEIYKKVTETDVMEKYHGLGTTVNVIPLNDMNGLPTRNLKQSYFEAADEVSGEAFAKEKLIRKIACTGCPIGCIHIGLYRNQFQEPMEYEYSPVAYDHELVFAVGTFIGIKDKNKILAIIDCIEKLGLDCITTGVLLGWITEAYKSGIITEKDLDLQVDFGNESAYIQIIENIVNEKNSFYKDLAFGTGYASKKYGGEDFAAVLGGHEIAGYHTGYGNLLGMAVGARHSHLDNAGYSIDQATDPADQDQIVDKLIEEEITRNILNCLVICLFARNIYDLGTVIKALETIGISWKEDELKKLGKKIFYLKIQVKKTLGFDYKKIAFPKRFFETETLHGKMDQDIAMELLRLYNKKIDQICSEATTLFATTESQGRMV
ncbi:aldehyde ferredoxin oxidoreductase family protein [Geosporobacter ferrireducens]|uniref:Aldehyde:ferredoxin oxidoreductase n=1 Tax=Geosporobacter ferrireducens TaxID=1424294 RepID=A0A1D8GP58_9FIRM|nr:aldehyde ferredoxin oxidoreductase C-terminal domain-containing protein [Geosporobacter ferrireducens]AOT72683.1 aldehyde:ferredoxin oxidoreductase [Geosporobacter ferrireducens]MTI55092.1 aldehyde:ferredoxin oxidoreductase [Geosporobacter ferrireducens]